MLITRRAHVAAEPTILLPFSVDFKSWENSSDSDLSCRLRSRKKFRGCRDSPLPFFAIFTRHYHLDGQRDSLARHYGRLHDVDDGIVVGVLRILYISPAAGEIYKFWLWGIRRNLLRTVPPVTVING